MGNLKVACVGFSSGCLLQFVVAHKHSAACAFGVVIRAEAAPAELGLRAELLGEKAAVEGFGFALVRFAPIVPRSCARGHAEEDEGEPFAVKAKVEIKVLPLVGNNRRGKPKPACAHVVRCDAGNWACSWAGVVRGVRCSGGMVKSPFCRLRNIFQAAFDAGRKGWVGWAGGETPAPGK